MSKPKTDRWLLILTIGSFALAGAALVVALAVMAITPRPETERPTKAEQRVEQLEAVIESLVWEPVPEPVPFVAPPPEEDPYVLYVEDAIARVHRGLEYHKGSR